MDLFFQKLAEILYAAAKEELLNPAVVEDTLRVQERDVQKSRR